MSWKSTGNQPKMMSPKIMKQRTINKNEQKVVEEQEV